MGARTGRPGSRGGGSPSTRLSGRRARNGAVRAGAHRSVGWEYGRRAASARSRWSLCAKAELSCRAGDGGARPTYLPSAAVSARREIVSPRTLARGARSMSRRVRMHVSDTCQVEGTIRVLTDIRITRTGLAVLNRFADFQLRSALAALHGVLRQTRRPHMRRPVRRIRHPGPLSFARGLSGDGGRGRGAPVRAEAAPRRHRFPAAEHETGLSEQGTQRGAALRAGCWGLGASDGCRAALRAGSRWGREWGALLRAEAAPRRHLFPAAEHGVGSASARHLRPAACGRAAAGPHRATPAQPCAAKRKGTARAVPE